MGKKHLFIILVLCIASLVAGNTGYAYEEVEVKDGGQIIGQVKFTGALQSYHQLRLIKMRMFAERQSHQRP